jgi:nucleoside-diphosphate-sugar epimerase
MRVFLAGATGVVGRQLVPLLVSTGHEVYGTTRSEVKAMALRAEGARPVVLDVLAAEATKAAVAAAEPDVIVHQATALRGIDNDVRHFDRLFQVTNQLRTEGTRNLLAAGQAVGVRRFVAQSFCGWPYAPVGGPIKDETAPLDPNPPKAFRQSMAALTQLEDLVGQAPGGVVLRYGGFYGPETSLAEGGAQFEAVRRRQFPMVGDAGGAWSFLHVKDAATATLAALTRGAGIYNIVDDDPAPVHDWLPYLAETIGAGSPRRVPVWLAGLLGGAAAVHLMTRVRGASNEKARRELSWKPSVASWRDGFRAELSPSRR